MQVNMNPNQTSPSNTQQPTPVQYSPQFITIPQNMLNFAPGTRFILSPYVPIQYIYPVITYTQNSFPGLQPLIPEPRPQPIQQQQQQIQIPIVPTPIISDEQRSSHFSDELLSNNGDQEQSKIVLESIITHNDDYESESDDYESSVDNDYNNNGNQDDSDNEDSDSSGSSIQFGIEPIEPQNMEIIDTHIKTESQQQTLDLQITDENKQENDQISEQSSPEIIFGKIDKQKQTQSELKETLSEAVIHKPTPALTSVTYQSIHQQSLPILSVKEKEKEQTNKRNNKQDQPRSSQLYKSELSKSQKKKSKSSIMRDESDFVYVKKNQSPKEVVELPNKASKAWKSRTVNTKEKEIRISEMIGNNQEKQKVNNNNNNNNNQPIQEDEYDKDLITRQCLSFLNRLTSSNIMDLVPEISKRLNSKESIKIFLIEMFEKAVYEKKYVSIYSKLSKILENECRLSDQGDEVFRRTLIELCQMEFEQALEISSMKHQKLTEIQEKHKQDKLQSDDQEQINLTQEYDDEEEDGMQRIRLCGIVSFIASLHIEGLLHPIVIRNCLRDLLKMDISNPIHANIEAFVTFLYKVGRVFDVGSKQKREVDLLLERLRSIQEGGKLTQRLKFMILEVEDERKRGFSFETALGTK
ncbi:MAG: hypothetical protein EZS28_010918 [Streblomastix strix]|uniref:MIF4G domain-containing protein n=1 Tax=Streblomastix strix TaxID=222440 RepID=A0A5J4WEY7_9EUKA|nr:MAG: hypothetical protein EZS28_010918 [Streblomastix strix]